MSRLRLDFVVLSVSGFLKKLHVDLCEICRVTGNSRLYFELVTSEVRTDQFVAEILEFYHILDELC